MNEKIRLVLNKIKDKGFEVYLVGGFVRDYFLGRETYDVDIATNALPKDIIEIFNLNTSTEDNYGSITFKDKTYSYEITTYRRDLSYEARKPQIEFVDDIKVDVLRRDFTINSLYMDTDGNIIEDLNGIEDLKNKIVRCIGNINDKMVEDPLRILRTIRFATLLDFKIEENLYFFIKQNKELISTLSYTRKKEELDKIFKSKNVSRGIEIIKSLGIEKYLDIKIDDVIPCSNYLGIWAQIEVSDKYPFSNQELDTIDAIKKVLKYGIIDNIVLYQYGLFVSIIAGEILGYQKSYISDIYKDMPIYNPKDIAINGDDIMQILNIEPSEKISKILEDLELNILHNNIKNEYEELKGYIIKNWK